MTAREELDRIRERQRIIGAAFLGDPAWEILLDLADAGKLRTSAAGSLTRVPPTTALRYLGMLEQRGFVERSYDEADKRVTLVSLTQSGREAVDQCLAPDRAG